MSCLCQNTRTFYTLLFAVIILGNLAGYFLAIRKLIASQSTAKETEMGQRNCNFHILGAIQGQYACLMV